MTHGAVRPLLYILSALSLFGLQASAVAADPVGANTCGSCHKEAFETWRHGPHAKAEGSLSPSERENPRCQQCHAPQAEAGLGGVQCEACHGDGQHYYPDYVMRDPELAREVGLVEPDEATCLSCHDAESPSLRGFDHARKLERIKHWVDDEGAER